MLYSPKANLLFHRESELLLGRFGQDAHHNQLLPLPYLYYRTKFNHSIPLENQKFTRHWLRQVQRSNVDTLLRVLISNAQSLFILWYIKTVCLTCVSIVVWSTSLLLSRTPRIRLFWVSQVLTNKKEKMLSRLAVGFALICAIHGAPQVMLNEYSVWKSCNATVDPTINGLKKAWIFCACGCFIGVIEFIMNSSKLELSHSCGCRQLYHYRTLCKSVESAIPKMVSCNAR